MAMNLDAWHLSLSLSLPSTKALFHRIQTISQFKELSDATPSFLHRAFGLAVSRCVDDGLRPEQIRFIDADTDRCSRRATSNDFGDRHDVTDWLTAKSAKGALIRTGSTARRS